MSRLYEEPDRGEYKSGNEKEQAAVCPKCEGYGWIVRTRKSDGVSAAERCDCKQNRDRTAEYMAKANIPPTYQRVDFDTFKTPTDNPPAKNALTRVLTDVRQWGSNYPITPKPGILISGLNGTGKTHLAVAALKMVIKRGIPGIFCNYQTLLSQIVASYNPAAGGSSREAYQAAMDCEVLLLDDIGANRAIDWAEDAVNSIITHRCNYRKGTIVTTNLADPLLGHGLISYDATRKPGIASAPTLSERIGERSRSRLFEMCRIVKMPHVEDFRPKVEVY